MNSFLFLTYCNANTSMLMLVWFTHEDMEGTWPKDQETMLQNGSTGKVTWTDDWT